MFSDPDLELEAINHYDDLRQRLQQPQDTQARLGRPVSPDIFAFVSLESGLAGLETIYKSRRAKTRG